MVDNQLHAVILVVTINLLITVQIELLEHVNRHESGSLAAPVVVMEQGVGLDMAADTFRQLQLKVNQVLDEVLHVIGLLIQVDQSLLDLTQVMALLKQARCHKGRHIILAAIHCLGLGNEGLPLRLGKLQAGGMDIITPVGNILDNDFLRGVHRERTRQAGGPGTGDAPAVDHVHLTRLGIGIVGPKRVHHHFEEFVLVDKAVRMSAVNGLQQILTNGQHKCLFLLEYDREFLSWNPRLASVLS